MQFFRPSSSLTPFIKEYFVVNFEEDLKNEIFFPSCFIDFAINISDGNLVTKIGERSIVMPRLEILGQITTPTKLQVTKGTSLLIARIYPYANSLFFPVPISELKNESVDLVAILSSEAVILSNELDYAESIQQKIAVLNRFFADRLTKNQNDVQKVKMIAQMCNVLCNESTFDIHLLADNFGLSDRYIQKLFETTVGLAPRSFFNTWRFNKSLECIRSTDEQLTSIAYSCGYFDQAHLIREFKRYTGITPSEARKSTKMPELKTLYVNS